MTTKATSAQGVQLKRGDGATSESFTKIAEQIDWKGPSRKANTIDATSFDSTSMESIGGLPDQGEVTLNGLFVGTDAQQAGLITDFNAQTLRNYQLVLNDQPSGGSRPTSEAFAARVTSYEFGGAVNQAVKFSVTLKITGGSTRTNAA